MGALDRAVRYWAPAMAAELHMAATHRVPVLFRRCRGATCLSVATRQGGSTKSSAADAGLWCPVPVDCVRVDATAGDRHGDLWGCRGGWACTAAPALAVIRRSAGTSGLRNRAAAAAGSAAVDHQPGQVRIAASRALLQAGRPSVRSCRPDARCHHAHAATAIGIAPRPIQRCAAVASLPRTARTAVILPPTARIAGAQSIVVSSATVRSAAARRRWGSMATSVDWLAGNLVRCVAVDLNRR